MLPPGDLALQKVANSHFHCFRFVRLSIELMLSFMHVRNLFQCKLHRDINIILGAMCPLLVTSLHINCKSGLPLLSAAIFSQL